MTNPNFQIRRQGKRTRYYIDNELLARCGKILKPHGIAIYNVLAKYANSRTQSCFPSYETIMSHTGIGKRKTITKYLKRLEKLNIIAIEHSKGRKPNRYYLLDVGCWDINSSPKDRVRNETYDDNSIPKGIEPYPSGTFNSIPNAHNPASMDTGSRIISRINKSNKINLSSFSNEKDERATLAHKYIRRTKEEQERINAILKRTKEELTEEGVFPPKNGK